MPQKEDHVNWAGHDRDFWTSIDVNSSPFVDWAVSGMFYEATHWVEAFLATYNHHSGTHGERARNMRTFRSSLRAIQTDYDVLKQDSETARYDCYRHNANEARQLTPLVENIKRHLMPLL